MYKFSVTTTVKPAAHTQHLALPVPPTSGARDCHLDSIEAASFEEAREKASKIFGVNPGYISATYLPEVGDAVSYGGNGDWYPQNVVEVSKTGAVVKTRPADGREHVRVFTRRKDGRYFLKGNKGWGGIRLGHHSELNPSF